MLDRKNIKTFLLDLMIVLMTALIASLFYTFVICAMHEAGHYLAALAVGYTEPAVNYKFGFPQSVLVEADVYDPLFKLKIFFVTMTGDLAGLIPVLGLIYQNKNKMSKWQTLVLILAYWIGCGSDLLQLWKIFTVLTGILFCP